MGHLCGEPGKMGKRRNSRPRPGKSAESFGKTLSEPGVVHGAGRAGWLWERRGHQEAGKGLTSEGHSLQNIRVRTFLWRW